MTLIEAVGVSVALTGSRSRVVDDVSFSLEAGEVLGVVGESGSGKSTLALALLGYVRRGAVIAGGEVRLDGVDLLRLRGDRLRQLRRDRIAYVPQDPPSALNPNLRLRTQLGEAARRFDGAVGSDLNDILRAVGLPTDDAFLKRRPRQLSGGQQQRVALAMAVAAGPSVVVLDEPTTGLDVTTQAMVLDLVRQLCRDRGMAAVYISHDLAVVQDVADQVLVMYAGKTMERGTTDQLMRAPTHPYTQALLSAVPSAHQRRRLVPIPGSAPSVGEHVDGCVFASRCDYAVEACRTAPPELTRTRTGGLARCVRADEAVVAPRAPSDAAVLRPAIARPDGVLRVEALSAGFGARTVLRDVSFQVAAGECVAVVGESGSGKTTLSRALVGLHMFTSGTVRFNGEVLPGDPKRRARSTRREMQYVFQNPYSSLNPRQTVGWSVGLPLRHFFQADGETAEARVRAALERVELPGRFADRYPAELSGGQQQRAAIARALICEPSLLICDEVTSALDVSVQAAVVELLRGLLESGLSMVFVTHNLAVVRSIADSLVVLNEGRVVEHGPAERVLDAPEHAYTKRLMRDTLEVSG